MTADTPALRRWIATKLPAGPDPMIATSNRTRILWLRASKKTNLGWVLVISAIVWLVNSFQAWTWAGFFVYALNALIRG